MTNPRRPAYSLIRFSSPQQALGDSARRQFDRTVAYCEAHNLEIVEAIRDEGFSGYHAVHRKRGAFGRFVKRFLAGEIPPGGVFIAEAFDRFTREQPRIAQQLFLTLVNGGLDVVTLIDGQEYTAATIDANGGQLFLSIGLMMGAHAESRHKADRIRETWKSRHNGGIGKETGLPNGVYPGWIIKTKDGPQMDKAKQRSIKRIAKLLLTTGTMDIAKRFNAEQVPTLTNRKTSRGFSAWQHASISALIRGKQVLGLQEIGRMENGKRVLTGEVVQAYPAALTEAERNAANAAIDARQKGTGTGRNRTSYANLFGPLAVCGKCRGRMVIRGKGSYSPRKYLGCQNSGAGHSRCDHKRYYQVDLIERDVFALISNLTWQDDEPDHKADDIDARLGRMRKERAKKQASLDRMAATFADAAPPIVAAMNKLSREITELDTVIAKLERQLSVLKTAKPADEQLSAVQSLSQRLARLSGSPLTEARGKIAMALPRLFSRFTFTPKGIHATMNDGRVLLLGEWIAAGGVLYQPQSREMEMVKGKRWDRRIKAT